MECKHEAVKSVNCALFCLKCGLRLPDDWLTKKHTNEAEKPLKTAAKAPKRAKGGKA